MTIPSPNLDDRTFREIRDEAVGLIPRYCPEWTNHNPADPGITMIEILASMAETLLYRMNRLPEKATAEYLRLLGCQLRPARPARVPVTFRLADGSPPRLVPRGTVVSTRTEEGRTAIEFETERDVMVGPPDRPRCLSRLGDRWRDLDPDLARGEPVAIFGDLEEADRLLYLGDPRLAILSRARTIHIEDGGQGFLASLRWEFHDGRRWREAPADRTAGGGVAIAGPLPGIGTVVAGGREAFWLRGRCEGPAPEAIREIALRASGEGMPPDEISRATRGGPPIPVDPGGPILPFGEVPGPGASMRIDAADALGPPDSLVAVRIDLDVEAPPPTPSADLEIVWEAIAGDGTEEIGRSRPDGTVRSSAARFRDGTAGLTRSGVVSFLRTAALGGREGRAPALQARIARGDFGHPVPVDADPGSTRRIERGSMAPPRIRSVRLSCSQVPYPPEVCLSWSDLSMRDRSRDVLDREPFPPFATRADRAPSLYLGARAPWPEGPNEIYFRVEEESGADRPPSPRERGRLLWEIAVPGGWAGIRVVDRTAAFTRSGTVTFEPPPSQVRREEMGEDLHWIRVRWEDRGAIGAPRICGVHPSTTIAAQGRTVRAETVGRSDETPWQVHRTAAAPTLGGVEVTVGRDPRPWREVSTLAVSGPGDRDFEFDPATGAVRFGDGRRGSLPPAGEIRATYRTGQGSAGCVGARTITVCRSAIAGIAAVSNPYAAEGGADAETGEAATARALRSLRTRDRAVTLDDYEGLALAASPWVSRAYARSAGDACVTVIVLPRPGPRRTPGEPVAVPGALLDEVRAHLEDRRLAAVRLACRGPSYLGIDVAVAAARAPGTTPARVEDRLRDRIGEVFDPWIGGPDGRGHPPGRPVTRAEVLGALATLEEIRGIERLDLAPAGKRIASARVLLPPHALPVLGGLDVRLEVAGS